MAVLIFLFGLIFGSFANVILLRFHTGESLLWRGSRCFSCGKRLQWFELIPFFSYIVLRGRCKSCRSKISLQYPLVELGSGILFLLLFWKLKIGNSLEIENWELIISIALIYGAWFCVWLASLYDLRGMILPDQFLIIAFFLGTGSFFLARGVPLHFLLSLGAGSLAFFFFFLLWLASHGRWMGLGDAKFALVLGVLLPPQLLLAGILLSFFLGGISAVILLVFKKARLRSAVPFGPFLFAGGLATLLAGEQIIDWYFELFS